VAIVPANQRKRSERAIANDAAIRDAAIAAIVRSGVDGLSLREVGKSAGLTHGAAYARYEDVNELLVDLWHSRLASRATNLLELSRTAVEQPSPDNVASLVALARDCRPEDAAMVEVLMTSRRIPVLLEEVEPFVKKYLQIDPDLSPDSSEVATRVFSLFGVMMVTVFEECHFGRDPNYLAILERVLLTALSVDPSTVSPGDYGDDDNQPRFVATDDLRTQLAYSTYLAVGKSGYNGATISRIARRVDCSPGAIYKLYKSKEDLVLDAFRRIVALRWIKDADFAGILDAESIARLLCHEASRDNALRRNFTLETVLAAAHNATLRPSVRNELKDPGGVGARLDVPDAQKKESLGYITQCIASASKAVRWLAAITEEMESLDFNHFAEPLRLALKNEWRRTSGEADISA
jgi:AcrR family transcriptional regulator